MGMKKYRIGFRHRPHPEEDFLQRHAQFLQDIQHISDTWCINPQNLKQPSDMKGELVSVVQLSKVLPKGCNGYMCYSFRGKDYLIDAGRVDDSINISFYPQKIDYPLLVNQLFPQIVQAFGCYRATIKDDDLIPGEFDIISDMVISGRANGLDIDGRDTVYRINAVNFYDSVLCMRAFGLTPQQILERLQGHVEQVSLLGNGVLIIYSSTILDDAEFKQIDSKIRLLLTL